MKITNKANLPQTLVNAVKAHTHKGGDYSASMLCNPIRVYWLNKRHKDELEEDVSQRIWSLFGTAMHYIIEKGADEKELSEKYLETKIQGKTLSGTCDLYDKAGTITDWKTDSVWTIIYGNREREREVQLNAYAYLFRKAGYEVNKLQIISLLRDWSKTEAARKSEYPQSNILVTEYKLWDIDLQDNFLNTVIGRFEAFKDIPDNELPECSAEDMWQKPAKYAVMKPGRKSALKVFNNMKDAEFLMASMPGQSYIEVREAKRNRCADYCPANKFCNQYQEYLKEKENDK